MGEAYAKNVKEGLVPQRGVLFLCNENAVRSPMAEALARRHFGGQIAVASVGLRRGELDPFSVAAMAEAGIDIAGHQPKSIDDTECGQFDVVVALTPESRDAAPGLVGPGTVIEYWAIRDPSQTEGNREAIMASYRAVRDALAARIYDRFPLS